MLAWGPQALLLIGRGKRRKEPRSPVCKSVRARLKIRGRSPRVPPCARAGAQRELMGYAGLTRCAVRSSGCCAQGLATNVIGQEDCRFGHARRAHGILQITSNTDRSFALYAARTHTLPLSFVCCCGAVIIPDPRAARSLRFSLSVLYFYCFAIKPELWPGLNFFSLIVIPCL